MFEVGYANVMLAQENKIPDEHAHELEEIVQPNRQVSPTQVPEGNTFVFWFFFFFFSSFFKLSKLGSAAVIVAAV